MSTPPEAPEIPARRTVAWWREGRYRRPPPVNAYTFAHPVTRAFAERFLVKVCARAKHVTGFAFVGKVLP